MEALTLQWDFPNSQQYRYDSAVCPESQKGQKCTGVHAAQHSQLVEGGDCPTLCCTDTIPPGALCVVLGTSVQGHEIIRVCPKEDNQDCGKSQGQ